MALATMINLWAHSGLVSSYLMELEAQLTINLVRFVTQTTIIKTKHTVQLTPLNLMEHAAQCKTAWELKLQKTEESISFLQAKLALEAPTTPTLQEEVTPVKAIRKDKRRNRRSKKTIKNQKSCMWMEAAG